MKNISEHILDIVQNSIRAKADKIEILISETNQEINIQITDNGMGMGKTTLQKVNDPFFTTRTTRKVGLGVPLLNQHAEQSGGWLKILSEKGKGTKLTAKFLKNNIDCLPMGDIYTSIALLISGNPEQNIIFKYNKNDKQYSISSMEIKEILEDVPLNNPKVANFLKDMIKENLEDINVNFN